MFNRRFFLVCTLALTSVVFCNCHCEKAAEKSVEIAVKKGLGANGKTSDVDFDSTSGTLSAKIKDEDGQESNISISTSDESADMTIQGAEGNFRVKSGTGAKIPDHFPSDVPIYPNMTVNMVMEMPGEGFSVTGGTTDSLDTVVEFYRKQCKEKGWTTSLTMSQPGESATLHYQKEDRNLMLTIAFSEGEVVVNIMAGTA